MLDKLRSNFALTEFLDDLWKWLDNQLAKVSVSGSHNDLSSVASDDHHTKYTDSEAQSAVNNDSDHGSTAPHNYFSGSHNDLSNIASNDHHAKYTDNEAQSAVNNDSDHGSTAPHNYFSGNYSDLSGTIEMSAIALSSYSDSISTSTVSPVIVITSDMDGWQLQKILLSCTALGSSGTTSVDIIKRSGGTETTVDTISISYDDADEYAEVTGLTITVNTGDNLYANVSSAATDMKGVSVVLTFKKV